MDKTERTPGRSKRRLASAGVALALAAVAMVSGAGPAGSVAILHPMQPIGNIDCCH